MPREQYLIRHTIGYVQRVREPIVSVIIPAHDRANLLEETLRCLIEQGDVRLEVIVVDDGSTDNTALVAERALHDLRLIGRVIRFDTNLGLSHARNVGLQFSCGSAIKFLDSDDLLAPGSLEAQLAELNHATLPRTIPYMRTEILEHGCQRPSGFPQISGDIVAQLLAGGFFGVHAPIVPFEVFNEVGGFDTQLPSMEDDDLWLRVALAGWRFQFSQVGTAIYRQHTGQMIHAYVTNRMACIKHLSKLNPARLTQEERTILACRLDSERTLLAKSMQYDPENLSLKILDGFLVPVSRNAGRFSD